MLIWDFYKKFHPNPYLFDCEPKMKDFVLAAQNIFPNRPLERKRPKSALLFINLNTFMEKNRA